MALIVEQKPLYKTLAAGQEVVFVINESTGNIVTQQENVNYTALLRVHTTQASSVSDTIGTFKATPNDAGVGIFDFSTILENYVSPDYNGADATIAQGQTSTSTWRGVDFENNGRQQAYHPLHIIDRYCTAQNSIKYFSVFFGMEYLGGDLTTPNQVSNDPNLLAFSDIMLMFNGVLYDTDILTYGGLLSNSNDFGYNLVGVSDSNRKTYVLQNDSGTAQGQMLSDAPTTQNALITDYGTLPFLNNINAGQNSFYVGFDNEAPQVVGFIRIKLFNSSDAQLGSSIDVSNRQTTGGYSAISPDVGSSPYATTRLLYFGAFPANLNGGYIADNSTYADWNTHKSSTAYYTIQPFAQSASSPQISIGEEYRINIVTGDCRYESIRLTWLNKHGTWDYYTFTKKSVRSLSTNRTNYTQLAGSWNNSTYTNRAHTGGQKNFRVNSRERIKINTDFVSEAEAIWFEQLINSTEVYILNGYNSDGGVIAAGNVNRYVEPTTVTTSSYVRKTKGNDKLIQYTFDIERASNRRTQRV